MSGAVRFVKTSVFSRQNLLKITTVRGYLGTGLKEQHQPRGLVYPRVCGVDSLVFNVFNAMRGLFMQIAYLFSGRIVFGFRRSGY